ncbi:hypothetical protein ABPG77_001331 [Micractinium sp. CCAP 211/92]
MQPSPPARASTGGCPAGGCSLDAGRKRAGTWLGTDIDLDQFRNTKRFKGQEVAWDLGMLHLAGSGPAAGPTSAAAAPVATATSAAASGGPSPDPPDSPMLSADLAGSPMQHSQPQGGPAAQAMQHTPRSESRTPSAQAGPGGGGGGQASVRSAGPRSRLAVGHTPVRLTDAPGLQLHPTSPSDPALEGQTDLRKATLMRRLQSRLLQAGADDSAVGSPPGKGRPPDEQQGQQQHWRPPAQQREQEQQQQQQAGGLLSLAINEAVAPEQLVPAAAAAAPGQDGSPRMQGGDFGATGTQPACATPAGQGQPQQRQLERELPDGGSCAMQISPAAGALRRL